MVCRNIIWQNFILVTGLAVSAYLAHGPDDSEEDRQQVQILSFCVSCLIYAAELPCGSNNFFSRYILHLLCQIIDVILFFRSDIFLHAVVCRLMFFLCYSFIFHSSLTSIQYLLSLTLFVCVLFLLTTSLYMVSDLSKFPPVSLGFLLLCTFNVPISWKMKFGSSCSYYHHLMILPVSFHCVISTIRITFFSFSVWGAWSTVEVVLGSSVICKVGPLYYWKYFFFFLFPFFLFLFLSLFLVQYIRGL